MAYLSDKHQQLTQSQQSGLMAGFAQLPFDQKIFLIGLSFTLGIGSAAMAWKGESSERIYFCLKTPTQQLRCHDKKNRPYRMTNWHWQQWHQEGKPDAVVLNKFINPQGRVLASNPYKPFWAVTAFAGFALSGWMLRHLQDDERKLTTFQDIADKLDTAKAEMQARSELLDSYRDVATKEVEIQADLELVASDRTVDIQKAEIYAQSEIEVTQMDAEDAIFDAKTAGMSEAQKQEYINFLRQQKTPYLQGSQTLQGTIDPNDKVQGVDQEVIPAATTAVNAPNSNNTIWVQNLVKQTALIWGNQGGGKSWLARYVIKLKKQAGYRVIVLDPDSNSSEWQGVESYHTWADIADQIRSYVEELESRLVTFNNSTLTEEQWRQKLWAEGKATALICEEATTYGDFIQDEELLSKFGKLALTKSRKQEMPVTTVAHNNTQTCMFGIKGLHNLVSKMLQVECLAAVDPVSLQPKSTGKARVKLDSSNEWLDVELPNLESKIIDFRDDSQRTSDDREYVERVYNLEFLLEPTKVNDKPKLSAMAQKLLEYLQRTERVEADVREFKSNFKVSGERFTVEQIKGWMSEIVRAEFADWIEEGIIKLKQS